MSSSARYRGVDGVRSGGAERRRHRGVRGDAAAGHVRRRGGGAGRAAADRLRARLAARSRHRAGSAVWAAGRVRRSLQRVTAIDAVDGMLRMAAAAAATSHAGRGAAGRWRRADAARATPDGPFDLVTASYVLNELAPAAALALLSRVWSQTSGALVLVEPGTPGRLRADDGVPPAPDRARRDDPRALSARLRVPDARRLVPLRGASAALGAHRAAKGAKRGLRGREVHVRRRRSRRRSAPRRPAHPPPPAGAARVTSASGCARPASCASRRWRAAIPATERRASSPGAIASRSKARRASVCLPHRRNDISAWLVT